MLNVSNIHIVLESIVNNHGRNVLKDNRKMKGLIADYIPSNNKDRKILGNIISENIPCKLLKAHNENKDIKNKVIQKCINDLEHEYGTKREVAEQYVDSFVYSLGWNKQIIYENLTIKECIKLGEDGDIKAQLYLGRIYYFGEKVEKDYKMVQKWYKKDRKSTRLNSSH